MCSAEDLVTYKEAAALLGVSERTVRRWIVKKELAAAPLGEGDESLMRVTRESIVTKLERTLQRARGNWIYGEGQ